MTESKEKLEDQDVRTLIREYKRNKHELLQIQKEIKNIKAKLSDSSE
jgi:hypothetical protein